MQTSKQPSIENELEVTCRDLQRLSSAKPEDPYKQVLHRKRFYVIDRRIRLQQVKSSHLRCADWEILKDGTLLTFSFDEWKVLNWFVELAKKGNLELLTAAELLGLQEDYRAFQARAIPELTKGGPCWNRKSLPSRDEVTSLQRKVRDHIETFLEKKTFTFTEFTPTLWIELDPMDDRRLVDHEFVGLLDERGLLYLFATLLRRIRLPIQKCPRCQNIFLKSRKDAGYCSRECQSLHYAQRKRGNRPPGKRGRPRKMVEAQQQGTAKKATTKKGESHHGTKRR